jgi:hypothetical protein
LKIEVNHSTATQKFEGEIYKKKGDSDMGKKLGAGGLNIVSDDSINNGVA